MRSRSLIALSLLALTSGALAQSSSALINEALDKRADLVFDTTLPNALKSIQEKTGIPIRASRSVYDTMPWGEQTQLTASIKQHTLREALSAVSLRMGLQYRVTDQELLIEPIPALERIGRRSTIDELNAINLLATTPFKHTQPQMTLKELVGAVDKQLVEANKEYAIENRADLGDVMVKVFDNQTLLDALEEVTKQTRATWYPWGKSIVVVPKEDHIRTLLNRPVTIRFAGVDVAQVLTELSRRSGVAFTIEPGAVQRIPVESRTIKLILENVSTRQALDSISGFTGLGYVMNESGVYIWNPASASSSAPRRDRVLTIMTIDGVQVLMPESEIPADVKQYLDAKRVKAIQTLREQMKKDGFVPTTQPTNPDL